jgi:glutaredoxin 3
MSELAQLYGTRSCQFTSEMREQLIWEGRQFVEYDVEADPAAMERLLALTGGNRLVPVLVEGDRVAQVGWLGRGCIAGVRR